MHSWKKKLVVSQLALACTLAITSQANATTYDTWTYYDNPVTALDWDHMDKAGTVDGNYVNYSGFVYYNNTNGDFDQSFNGDTVNGTISTYYLNHDYADSTANQWICPYISRHLLSLNPSLAHCRRYSRGER